VQGAAAVAVHRSHQAEGTGGALRHQGANGLVLFSWEVEAFFARKNLNLSGKMWENEGNTEQF